ncbi:MAG: hypothetical protein ACK5N0_06390 [Synechococcaceae cyanobacterium]
MTRTLGTIQGEGFDCTIQEDPDGRVYFTADADIDADGANGQHGAPAAYRVDDSGSEALANGGMAKRGNTVVCAQSWARDVVITNPDGNPRVFPGGVIASKTWYQIPGRHADDPQAYVDAATVPYIVVPPVIIRKTQGVVRGCRARVSLGSKSVECVVADQGPSNRIGELSIAAAAALGLPSSPRNGGTEEPVVLYELWPGKAAPGYVLQPA